MTNFTVRTQHICKI